MDTIAGRACTVQRFWTAPLRGAEICVFQTGQTQDDKEVWEGKEPRAGCHREEKHWVPNPWGNEMRKWGVTFPCKIASFSTFSGDSWILNFSSGFPSSALQKSPTLHPSVGPIPDGGRLVGSSPSWFVVFGSSDLAGAGTGGDKRLPGVSCGSSSSGSTTNLQHQEKSGCSFLPLKYPPKKQFLWICPCTASADPS